MYESPTRPAGVTLAGSTDPEIQTLSWEEQEACDHAYVDCYFTIGNGSLQLCPICTKCGKKLAAKKQPHNVGKKKRTEGTNNDRWHPYLRSLWPDGKLHCFICDITTDEPKGHGEVHHILPLEELGEDVETNVAWTCTFCHRHIHAQRDRTRMFRDIVRKAREKAGGGNGKP